MKHLITCTLIIIFTSSLFAQTDTIRSDQSKLYLVNNIYKDGFHIFLKNDTVVQCGSYFNNRPFGKWKYFHSNGKIKSSVNYDTTSTSNTSDYNGDYAEYYPNGNIKIKGKYKIGHDSIECVNCFNPRDFSKQIETAEFPPSIKIGTWTEFHKNGQIKSKGNYYSGVHQTFNSEWQTKDLSLGIETLGTDYLKEGKWEYYSKNGKLIKYEFYKKGVFIGEETFK